MSLRPAIPFPLPVSSKRSLCDPVYFDGSVSRLTAAAAAFPACEAKTSSEKNRVGSSWSRTYRNLCEARRSARSELLLDFSQLNLLGVGQILQEFVEVGEAYFHCFQFLEVDGGVSSRDFLVDNFRLLHPLITLRERYLLAVGFGVAEFGKRFELLFEFRSVRRSIRGPVRRSIAIVQRQSAQFGRWCWGVGCHFFASISLLEVWTGIESKLLTEWTFLFTMKWGLLRLWESTQSSTQEVCSESEWLFWERFSFVPSVLRGNIFSLFCCIIACMRYIYHRPMLARTLEIQTGFKNRIT